MEKVPAEFRSKIELDWELATGHIVKKEKQYECLVRFFQEGEGGQEPRCHFHSQFFVGGHFRDQPKSAGGGLDFEKFFKALDF